MTPIPYLLFQAKPNDEYETVSLGLSSNLSNDATVGDFMKDVVPGIRDQLNLDASQKVAFQLHFLLSPLPSALYCPIEEYEKRYGPFGRTLIKQTKEQGEEVPLSDLLFLREGQVRLAVIYTIKRQPEHATNPSREDVIKAALKRDPPAIEGRASTSFNTQREDCPDAIYNGYPIELTAPEISIYHPIFATFQEKMERPLEDFKFEPAELRRVYDLMCKSLELYASKADRKRNLTDLKYLIHKEILNTPLVSAGSNTFVPDGLVFANCEKIRRTGRAATAFCAIENEMGLGGSDPLFKAQCDYVAFWSGDGRPAIREASCCPSFVIGIAGPNIGVSGAVFADRFIVQRLTSYLWLGNLTQLPRSMLKLAKVFRILRECLEDLTTYYENLPPCVSVSHSSSEASTSNAVSDEAGIPLRLSSAQFPHFREFQSVDGKVVELRYLQRLFSSNAEKPVFKALAYTAEAERPSTVLVRFLDEYCRRGHELLAQASLAPKLWFCEQVDSVRQHVVVMDFIEGTTVREDSSLPMSAVTALREAISILHDNNLVYGALQAHNIVLPTNHPKAAVLVDFNWCGEEGTASYPFDVETASEPEWHPDVSPFELIRKEHDNYKLDRLERVSCEESNTTA